MCVIFAPPTVRLCTGSSGPANSDSTWRQAPHGGTGRARGGQHEDGAKSAVAAQHSRRDRVALGTHPQAVGGILDVGALGEVAVLEERGGADGEAGVRGIRPFPGRGSGTGERLPVNGCGGHGVGVVLARGSRPVFVVCCKRHGRMLLQCPSRL